MKKYIILFSLIFWVSQASAVDIIIRVPDAKFARVKAAFLIAHPNLECLEYVDLTSMECKTKKYTDNQWIRERIRRFLREGFQQGETAVAVDAAKAALPQDYDTIPTAP